jgi:hypothetical protein
MRAVAVPVAGRDGIETPELRQDGLTPCELNAPSEVVKESISPGNVHNMKCEIYFAQPTFRAK